MFHLRFFELYEKMADSCLLEIAHPEIVNLRYKDRERDEEMEDSHGR
jgi:hypothetical protein